MIHLIEHRDIRLHRCGVTGQSRLGGFLRSSVACLPNSPWPKASERQRAAPTIMPGSSVGSPTSESSDVEGDKCPICLRSFTEDAVTAQGCGHMYHRTCIFGWMGSGGSNAGDCPVCRRDLDSVDGSAQGIIAGAYAFTIGQLERIDEEDGDDEQEHEQLGDDVQNPDQEEEPAQSSSGPSSEGNTSRSELDADADAGGSNDDGRAAVAASEALIILIHSRRWRNMSRFSRSVPTRSVRRS